jgi:hypothetical protein
MTIHKFGNLRGRGDDCDPRPKCHPRHEDDDKCRSTKRKHHKHHKHHSGGHCG